jgi:tRNA A-37 threonylcarbamoyl transferase component Bud32
MAHPSSPERWQRVEQLLDAALDLPPEKRSAFLDCACAGDADLLAEVERLLRAFQASEHFLGESAQEFAAPIVADLASRAESPAPAAPGARIGPYRILEEAGRGGMAVVYLAERDDGQFRKRVALKLVRAGVIPEDELLRRFREERQILAELEHPGIARLLDGGVTDEGLPWFALEYVEGTPIDHFCDERRLDVAARLALFRAVCDAVQHAHRRRIVHRDLKPGNILVTEPDGEAGSPGQVKLLDFGIAKLLVAESGGEAGQRTRPGLRLLTPEYASPEQLRGDPVTPAADVYALGVLLGRLLADRRADGATGPEPLRRRLPGDLHAIVRKATHEQPVQRYTDAGALGAEVRLHLRGARVGARPAVRRRHAVLAVGAATLALALALAAWFPRNEATAPAIDPGTIVIAPFHVAADGSLAYLREGLVDLLATSLNGETGSRAVDPRTAIAAWRSVVGHQGDDVSESGAQAAARRLGAGRLLMGSLVGTPAQLTLNATLFDTARETVLVRISVQGSEEQLQSLVDAVAAQLLAREAELPRHQLAAVTTRSLPALRSYLAGRQSYRLGHLGEAVRQLEEALSHDSTFALAATHLWLAAGDGPLTATPGTRERAVRLAWAGRDGLSAPDRLVLEAIAGPRYPEPTPRHERLAALTRAVNASPDRPEVLGLMGGTQLAGVLRGEPDARQRSSEYFSRALALDSSYAWAAYHVVREAADVGDAATVRRVVRRYLATDSTSEIAHVLTWIHAAIAGDERAIREVRARMPTMHPTALGWIVFHALTFGRDMDGAEAALAAMRAKVRSEYELENFLFREWEVHGNRGRLTAMWNSMEEDARRAGSIGPIEGLGVSAEMNARARRAHTLISTSLYWRGDTAGVAEALSLMEDMYRRSPSDRDPSAHQVVAESACHAATGRVATGNPAAANVAVAQLRELLEGDAELPRRLKHALCAATVEALIAVAARRPEARALVERADSIMRRDPPNRLSASRMQILLARAFDELGDPEAGLRVIRRRVPTNPPYHFATILAEEGRLAARVGDREGAIRAYRHYLALRTQPDPALVPEVERIRAELAGLLASR